MTASPPTAADSPEQRAARLASGYYNADDLASGNPGGMGDDGHVVNLPLALSDVGLVAQHVGALAGTATGAAEAAAGSATTAAAQAGLAAGHAIAAAQSDANAAASAALATNAAAAVSLPVPAGADSGKWLQWSGAAWALGIIQTATTAVAGLVRLATAAEVVAGTATDRAVTPAGAAAVYLRLAGGTLAGPLRARAVVTLADAPSITPDFAAGNDFTVTLAGNRTLANPINAAAGQGGSILIRQDATGGRTLAFGSAWLFPGATAPVLTFAGGRVDRLDYWCPDAATVHAQLAEDIR